MNKITSKFVKFVIIASAVFALVPTFAPTPVEAFCAKQVVDPFQLFLKCKKSSNSKKVKTPAVTNVSCRVDDTTVGVGDEVVWSASASGGNGTYRYHWRGTENLTGTDQTITKTYTTAGFKFAYVRVYSGDTYSAEIQCSNSPRVRDYDNPDTNSNMRVTCEADDDTVPVNSRVEWTVTATSGKSPYTYEWSGSSGLTGTDKTISKRYTSNGTKSASVTVTDNSGDQRTVDCGHVVVRDGNEDRLNDDNDDESDNNNSNSNLGASCYASPTLIQAGETTSWGVAAYGGNGVYSYSWSGTDGLSGNSSYVLKSYTTPGTKSASVRVSSNGRSVTVNCAPSVFVNGSISGAVAPSQIPVNGGALNVVCSVNKASSVVGSSVTWSTSVTGGNGQYEYIWSGTDGITARNSTLTAMYDTVGAKTALVTVRSGDHVVNRACGTVNVTYSAPRPVATGSNAASPAVSGNLQVVCKAQDDSVARGESVIWTAEVKGGNGTYKYSWNGADSLSGDQAVIVKSYNTDGKKFAMVNVSSGRQNVAQACDSVVEVGSFLGAAALLGASWIGAGIFLIFVLFLVIAYVLYNKSKI